MRGAVRNQSVKQTHDKVKREKKKKKKKRKRKAKTRTFSLHVTPE
jgi:hypothetical protein